MPLLVEYVNNNNKGEKIVKKLDKGVFVPHIDKGNNKDGDLQEDKSRYKRKTRKQHPSKFQIANLPTMHNRIDN